MTLKDLFDNLPVCILQQLQDTVQLIYDKIKNEHYGDGAESNARADGDRDTSQDERCLTTCEAPLPTADSTSGALVGIEEKSQGEELFELYLSRKSWARYQTDEFNKTLLNHYTKTQKSKIRTWLKEGHLYDLLCTKFGIGCLFCDVVSRPDARKLPLPKDKKYNAPAYEKLLRDLDRRKLGAVSEKYKTAADKIASYTEQKQIDAGLLRVPKRPADGVSRDPRETRSKKVCRRNSPDQPSCFVIQDSTGNSHVEHSSDQSLLRQSTVSITQDSLTVRDKMKPPQANVEGHAAANGGTAATERPAQRHSTAPESSAPALSTTSSPSTMSREDLVNRVAALEEKIDEQEATLYITNGMLDDSEAWRKIVDAELEKVKTAKNELAGEVERLKAAKAFVERERQIVETEKELLEAEVRYKDEVIGRLRGALQSNYLL
ncbi:hypothetical protein FMUND_14343 [Fusarium mundagurra]|uniref:Uncharacterized protein n=1 Tax=Fusarium mundagurra TaxID=1567541 RepID=A0A8H5XVT1_9HYPO|nr:hypothetical protein FMUND_14343 [Fusarium mundagurra]